MGAIRNERHQKLNNDKKYDMKKRAIKQLHKTNNHLSATEMYYLDKELSRDYFPAE